MKIIPTVANQRLVSFDSQNATSPDTPENFADISLATPDQQFAALVAMVEANDQANPTPFTGTPPWGEPSPEPEWITEGDLSNDFLLPADIEEQFDREEMRSIIEDAKSSDIPEWDWENDDQYFGLGVPPGAPAVDQPFETGHTQNIRPDSSMNRGVFAWSGKPSLARTARHENAFRSYSAGVNRGHMIRLDKYGRFAYQRSSQARNLMLSELNRRGIHNVTIVDVPAVPYNEQIMPVDPTMMIPEPHIDEATGVLP